MDRYWFLTWRTYGSWLPGDDGFVGYYQSPSGRRIIDHAPGTPRSEALPRLAEYARCQMRTGSVRLDRPQADRLLDQLRETAQYRTRPLDAVAVLVNHVHIVYGVEGDPDPDRMLADWKAYASRALNRLAGGGRRDWWAENGSKRRLKAEANRVQAIRYVRDQVNPLIVWLSEEAIGLLALSGEPGASATGWRARRVMANTGGVPKRDVTVPPPRR